jgi:hypothetical protein
MCTVLLPPGVNPIAVNIIYHIWYGVSNIWEGPMASISILKKETAAPPKYLLPHRTESEPYRPTVASVKHYGTELGVKDLAYGFQKGHVRHNRNRPSVPNTRLIFFAPIKNDSGNF